MEHELEGAARVGAMAAAAVLQLYAQPTQPIFPRYEERLRQQQKEGEASESGDAGSLNMNRLGDLNDPNVDLSAQLRCVCPLYRAVRLDLPPP